MFVTSVIIGVITDCLLMLTVRLRKHGPFILGDCKIISTAQRIISELASVGSRGQGSLAGQGQRPTSEAFSRACETRPDTRQESGEFKSGAITGFALLRRQKNLLNPICKAPIYGVFTVLQSAGNSYIKEEIK